MSNISSKILTEILPIAIPEALLQRCFDQGAQIYPEECCGVLSGAVDAPGTLDGFHPVENIINRLHKEDPERYPRSGKDGYVMEPQTLFKLERQLGKEGREVRVYYHTHPDVGAYFSEEDQKRAMWGDAPLLPGVFFLVCGVKDRKPDGAILAWWDETARAFTSAQVLDPPTA